MGARPAVKHWAKERQEELFAELQEAFREQASRPLDRVMTRDDWHDERQHLAVLADVLLSESTEQILQWAQPLPIDDEGRAALLFWLVLQAMPSEWHSAWEHALTTAKRPVYLALARAAVAARRSGSPTRWEQLSGNAHGRLAALGLLVLAALGRRTSLSAAWLRLTRDDLPEVRQIAWWIAALEGAARDERRSSLHVASERGDART